MTYTADDRLRTPREVAVYLGRTPAPLAQLRYLGRGPQFIKTGSLVRFRRSAVELWVSMGERQRTI